MSVIQGNAFSDDAVDTGDIGHSLRFRSGSYLTRTPGGSGSRRKLTLSMWVKRCALGVFQRTFGADDIGSTTFCVGFNTNNKLEIRDFSGSYLIQGISTQVFRDTTSWIHVVVAFDTDQATFANGVKAYVNGTQITAWDTSTYSGVHDLQINDTRKQSFGVYLGSGSPTAPFDYGLDYLARACLVTGSQETPSSFGYLNTEINEWVTKSQSAVKAVVDAGGTNSFMLDFDDATSLTTLGYDKSSKGNNWTLNNFSLTAGTTYDHMLDVPGNSFATLNAIYPNSLSGVTTQVSNANLQINSAAASYKGMPVSVLIPATGKWYAEVTNDTLTTNSGPYLALFIASLGAALNVDPTTTSGKYGWFNGLTRYLCDGVGGSTSALSVALAANSVLQVAIDVDNSKVYFGINNVWYSAVNTTTSIGGTPTFSINAAGMQVATTTYGTGNTNCLLGQAPLHASATYDSAAGGYFRYTPPTGFKALCQANLPDVAAAVLNPTDGFVAVTATEDNIDSTLASARSGWSDFVDVKKNMAAVESWAWQFSHDSTNEYAVSASSLVRQAKRAMSGSNTWEGFSIRIGASYGTAAGSVSHTNGVATTITHNIGVSARQMILLFNRAGGTAVPMYHPDLTSGELLDLCTTAADAASTAITSVLTNSFQIGSGVATGTYDYLVCSELSGLFDLGKWTGNASADGAYYYAGHKPSVLYAKALSTTDDHRVYNALRPGYNVIGGVVLANTTAAETTAAEMDFTSQGMKARITTTPNAAQTYVTASWASVAGKYSLGR